PEHTMAAHMTAQSGSAKYCPQAASGVVVSRLNDRNGIYYIIKNPAASTYYRLSEPDHFLWQRMDGTRTISDLVVAFFSAYGSFAFERVTALVAGLRANRFLTDQPAGQSLQSRNIGRRVAALWQTFLQKQFAISGMDRYLAAIYNRGGWLLFTWPAQAIFAVVSLVGVVMYVRLFASGAFSYTGAQRSVASSLLWLLLLNLVSILLHELSHGLTVKHYGREVRRAGFMIYFGLPAFFVDTTDIWLEGKRARLAVSWAGPYSGLILAGICGIVLTLWPGLPVNGLLYQFAFLALLTVFINLNPLLELDGYYLLMDWLEIPMLRRKSLAFLRSGLWTRLRSGPHNLSRDEGIYSVFGLLSALWTVYAVVFGIKFWQERLAGSLASLLRTGGDAPDVALALAGMLISLVFIATLGTYPLQMAQRCVRWIACRCTATSIWQRISPRVSPQVEPTADPVSLSPLCERSNA
ncbi:MAG: hypothetical protein KC487_14990, partial [Anaerolineae bacterium]|nr:hypothetical protein [Anaerolineae bacterium]